MSHKLPPVQCSTNTYSFTDTLIANSTKVRKPHVDELRAQIEAELTRRGLAAGSGWTDPTLTANSTKIRKAHIDDLRSEIEAIHSGRGDSGYCPGDTVTISWTDSTVTANSTKIKKTHFDEMRTTLNALKSGCICETEQCEYCADCGYYYQTFWCGCYVNSVGCCNSCGPQGCSHYGYTDHRVCASINVGGTHPYKSASGDPLTTEAWDGTVPWNWGDGIPGAAINWTSYWTCKCNPFTW